MRVWRSPPGRGMYLGNRTPGVWGGPVPPRSLSWKSHGAGWKGEARGSQQPFRVWASRKDAGPQGKRRGGRRGRPSQAEATPKAKVGLAVPTLRPRPEVKPAAGGFTHGASRLPLDGENRDPAPAALRTPPAADLRPLTASRHSVLGSEPCVLPSPTGTHRPGSSAGFLRSDRCGQRTRLDS